MRMLRAESLIFKKAWLKKHVSMNDAFKTAQYFAQNFFLSMLPFYRTSARIEIFLFINTSKNIFIKVFHKKRITSKINVI